MKPLIYYYIVAFYVLSLLGCSKRIDGEVFIVTNGGNNVKLGLVNVNFLSQEQLFMTLDSNSVQYKNALEKYYTQDSIKEYEHNTHLALSYIEIADKYKEMARMYNDSKFYKDAKENIITANKFAAKRGHYTRMPIDKYLLLGELVNLHNPISSISNAEGKFTAELKNQTYRVYASGSRKIGDNTENYVWSFDYTPDGKLLILSNNNMKTD